MRLICYTKYKMKTAKHNRSLNNRINFQGWLFVIPATILICCMSFYPMIRALILSFQKGVGSNMSWTGADNYARLFHDKVFIQALTNTSIYLILQVPVMIIWALVLATMLNDKNLKFKGFFRTAIFLPCTVSLVAYAIIFRSMFSVDGFVNAFLLNTGILNTRVNWLGSAIGARSVIIIGMIWRWTGFNMILFLAALQNVDYSVYEAAKIDGASAIKQFFSITLPLVKPTILFTAIMSTNGALQLFDESFVLTNGGPANATITLTHYIYRVSFQNSPNFGYAAAMSYFVLALVAILAIIQMKVGDKR